MTNYNRTATTQSGVQHSRAASGSLVELLCSLPLALWQFLCALGTRRVVEGLSLTICIFAFFGIVGGIESGLISFGLGALMTLPLVAIEIICLLPKKN